MVRYYITEVMPDGQSKGRNRQEKTHCEDCGIGNADGKKYILHFVHKDPADGDVRVTIVGNNQAGFTIAFAKDSETVIDAEFKAQPMDKEGTLILYEEDMDTE